MELYCQWSGGQKGEFSLPFHRALSPSSLGSLTNSSTRLEYFRAPPLSVCSCSRILATSSGWQINLREREVREVREEDEKEEEEDEEERLTW